MARGLQLSDLTPRGNRRTSISASTTLSGLLIIKVKRIPEAEILQRFQDAINKTSKKVAIDLKTALDQAIQADVWQATGGATDIMDTGKLMESGSVSITSNGLTIAYNEPYAALVHYGGYITPYGNSSTRVYLPPRPWIEAVLSGGGPVPAFDFKKYYKAGIEAEFSR